MHCDSIISSYEHVCQTAIFPYKFFLCCCSALHLLIFLSSRKIFPGVSKNEVGEGANMNSSFCWKVLALSKDAFEQDFEVLARFIGLSENTWLNIPSHKLLKISM